MNKIISTVIIAPLTTQSHFSLTRIPLKFAGKEAWVVLDQSCTVKVNQRCLAPLGNFLRVWVRKGSLWYNYKNIIGFGVGFLKW